MTAPTREDLFKIGADVALARSAAREDGRRLSPEEVYTEGSDANIMIAASSAMGEEVIRTSTKRVCDVLMSSAEGEALDRVVLDRYNGEVVRLEASPSVGPVVFSRDLAKSALDLTVEAGRKVRAKGGQVFRLVSPVTFSAGAAGPVSGTVQALETGPQGNVLDGEIEALVVPLVGVSVTNLERMAGGDDSEPDKRFRERASRFFTTARRGVIGAIEFGALSVSGIRRATAIERVDENGDPDGRVDLFVSDAAGAGNAALSAKVRVALDDWRAAGATVYVFASVPRFEPVVVRPRFLPGVDSTVAFDRFRTTLVLRTSELAPAAAWQRSLIFEVGRSIPGMLVEDDFVQVPAGDVVPAEGESVRTLLSLIEVG